MPLEQSNRYKLHQPVVETDEFIVGFPLFGVNDLTVYVGGVLNELYSVVATFTNGRSDDAVIQLVTAVSGVDVEIYGTRIPRRDDDYIDNSPALAQRLQEDADRLTAVQQEQARDYGSTIRVSPNSPVVTPLSGSAADRADRVIAFDETGFALTLGPKSDEIASAQGYAVAAGVSAEAAGVSADAAAESAAEAKLYDGPKIDEMSELPAVAGEAVDVGTQLRVIASGGVLVRAPDAATDFHIDHSGTGGVKWYVLPRVDGSYNVQDFGLDFSVSSSANDAIADKAIDVAREAGVTLDWCGQLFERSDVVTYTETGRYSWKGFNLSKLTGTTGEHIIEFTGTDFGAAIALTADVAVGDTSAPVAAGQDITAGDRFLLISTKEYNPDAGSNKANVSEYVTIKSYSGTTVTFEQQLQSSYETADFASLFKCNFEDIQIGIEGKMTGLKSLEQTGIKALNCCFEETNLTFLNVAKRAFWADECSSKSGRITLSGNGIDTAGFGYLGALSGCDKIPLGDLQGKDIRHLITANHGSKTLTLNGGPVKIMGGGVQCGDVQGKDCISAIVDTHASIRYFQCGNVTGSVKEGSTQPCVTIQSADAQIGNVMVQGFDQVGLQIQCFGKPLDEPAPVVTFGHVNTGRAGNGTDAMVSVENRAASIGSKLYVNVASATGHAPRLAYATAYDGAGDTVLNIGSLTGEATATHAVFAVASGGVGRATINVRYADISFASEEVGLYLCYAIGTQYEIVNTGEVGAFINIDSGSLARIGVGNNNTYLFREIEGEIQIGANVELTYELFSSGTEIYRVDRTAITS
ncbi:hypothetical protein [Tritonibacter mobilis]|uniref:hypothetical protein n=1 Tax=Tritonibacter mobilis TaxID=379347 RepID=UPI000806ADD1|nr:hypothetical protein [Tritonibacter mobilis]